MFLTWHNLPTAVRSVSFVLAVCLLLLLCLFLTHAETLLSLLKISVSAEILKIDDSYSRALPLSLTPPFLTALSSLWTLVAFSSVFCCGEGQPLLPWFNSSICLSCFLVQPALGQLMNLLNLQLFPGLFVTTAQVIFWMISFPTGLSETYFRSVHMLNNTICVCVVASVSLSALYNFLCLLL